MKMPLLNITLFETDYDFWLKHIIQEILIQQKWAIGDFARPLLKYVKGKYPIGRFSYSAVKAVLRQQKNQNLC